MFIRMVLRGKTVALPLTELLESATIRQGSGRRFVWSIGIT